MQRPVEQILQSPDYLMGSVDGIVEKLLEQRERHHISHVSTFEWATPRFRPNDCSRTTQEVSRTSCCSAWLERAFDLVDRGGFRRGHARHGLRHGLGEREHELAVRGNLVSCLRL